jgi:hypothetical protein
MPVGTTSNMYLSHQEARPRRPSQREMGNRGGSRETLVVWFPITTACGECRRNYMADNPKVPGSNPGRANMQRGSSTDRASNVSSTVVAAGLKIAYAEAECWPGLHPVKICVSAKFLVRYQEDCWRMPAGVHGTRQKALAGSTPAPAPPRKGRAGISRQQLSPALMGLRRMPEELHVICGFSVQVRAVPPKVR